MRESCSISCSSAHSLTAVITCRVSNSIGSSKGRVMESHFAALRIPDAPEKSLTRAISYSELPTSRRIVIQQSETSGELVRQYSCEHIYDKRSNTRQFNVLTSITSRLTTPSLDPWNSVFPKPQKDTGWHTRIPSLAHNSETLPTLELNGLRLFESPPKPPKSPKRSPNSTQTSTMIPPKDNVYNYKKARQLFQTQKEQCSSAVHCRPEICQSPSENPQHVDTAQTKKKLRPLAPQCSKSSDRKRSLYKLLYLAVISLAVLVMSAIVLEFNQKHLDLTNTTIALRNNVLWQDEAVDELSYHLQSNFDNFTAVLLVGGMGVGKTFTTSIIKKYFPYQKYIFEYYPPIVEHMSSAYRVLTQRHCNLIIFDNLRADDVRDFVEFAKVVQEQKICAIMMGVLNPQIVDEQLVRTMDLEKTVGKLRNLFEEEEIKGKVIKYQPLASDAIDDCIMREVGDSDVVLTDKNYQIIKTQLLMMKSGCKGANAKVNLLGKRKT